MYSVIITAGGTSSRFGNSNKLLEVVNGKTVLAHTVNAFSALDVDEIIICSNQTIMSDVKKIFENNQKVIIVEGGNTRQASVYNGLQIVKNDYVLIHDGARPIISPTIIQTTMDYVLAKKAVSVMTKTVDTIKEVQPDGRIVRTIDRSKLYNTQTPQAFETKLIKKIHEKYKGKNFTDDAGMVEAAGKPVYMVVGDYRNIKITTQSDMAIAKIYLG